MVNPVCNLFKADIFIISVVYLFLYNVSNMICLLLINSSEYIVFNSVLLSTHTNIPLPQTNLCNQCNPSKTILYLLT